MATVLVVDDSTVERRRAGALLEKRPGLTQLETRTGLKAVYAANGREALAAMEQAAPDLVVTDLQMPEMNGLELVEQIRTKYPSIPVVLMTAHGTDEIAVLALQRGAASYVPKKNLAWDLRETVENILALSQASRAEQRLLECFTRSEAHFALPNELSLIPALGDYLQNSLKRMHFGDESSQLHVIIAVREAVVNAIEHGNLEVGSALKDTDEKAYQNLIAERRGQAPYRDRRVHVSFQQSPGEIACLVRDDGPGFDPSKLPDARDPINLERSYGRGLLLIRTFMDQVSHSTVGNEITMVKRQEPLPGSGAS